MMESEDVVDITQLLEDGGTGGGRTGGWGGVDVPPKTRIDPAKSNDQKVPGRPVQLADSRGHKWIRKITKE